MIHAIPRSKARPFSHGKERERSSCVPISSITLATSFSSPASWSVRRSGIPAMYKLGEGIFWLFIYALFSSLYTIRFALSDEFLKYSFIRRRDPHQFPRLNSIRLWYIHWLGFSARSKFYGGWIISESACVLCRIGFNGYDPDQKPRWDGVTNVSPVDLETAQNSKEYIAAWNRNTHKWLRYYVYFRVTPQGKTPGFPSAMATFIASAVWHGFYPGYYLFFLSVGFVQACGKRETPLTSFLMGPRLSTTSPSTLLACRAGGDRDEKQDFLR
jgi:lysophospholipid acyltransferase